MKLTLDLEQPNSNPSPQPNTARNPTLPYPTLRAPEDAVAARADRMHALKIDVVRVDSPKKKVFRFSAEYGLALCNNVDKLAHCEVGAVCGRVRHAVHNLAAVFCRHNLAAAGCAGRR